MQVLVTFAVDAEFAPWRKLRAFRETLLSESPGSNVRVQDGKSTVTRYGLSHRYRDQYF